MQDAINFILQLPTEVLIFILLPFALPLAIIILKIVSPILDSLKPLPIYDPKISRYRLPKRPGEKRLAYWVIIPICLLGYMFSTIFSSFPWWWIILIFFIVYFAAFLARTKEIATGGIIGSVAGLILGLSTNADLTQILISSTLWGAIGLIFDFVLSRNYKKLKERGRPVGFWNSWDGFKGFGRGSSGGGGSSGSW